MVHIIFRDMLLSFLLGLTALVVIVLSSLNPPRKTEQESVTPPGNLAITMCWPEGAYDVDLWVLAPGEQKPVGFSNRGSKVLNLLRDDLGTNNDSMPTNCENVFSRGLPDGEYIANVHYWKGKKVPLKVSVEVRVTKPGEASQQSFVTHVTLVREGQESTAMRFRMRNGTIDLTSVHKVFKPLRSADK